MAKSTIVSVMDIAKASKVSVPAVYQALNQTGRLNLETRQRILKVAAKMGYRANAAAKAISTGRFGCVALLLSTHDRRSTLPDRLLAGVSTALAEEDLHLTVALLPDEKLKNEGFVPKILRQWMADGLLINYTDHIPPEMIQLINERTMPSVWFNVNHRHNCVHPDDLRAGREATEYLLRLGHKRIAMANYSYGPDPDAHYSATDRQSGYEKAMKAAGFATQVIRPDTLRMPGDQRFIKSLEWLSKADRPTAVVCYSGTTAVPIRVAALTLGIRVPEDLSIVTFDPEVANYTGVNFTTYIVPSFDVGVAGVKMLQQRISNVVANLPSQPIRFLLDPGNSCKPLHV